MGLGTNCGREARARTYRVENLFVWFCTFDAQFCANFTSHAVYYARKNYITLAPEARLGNKEEEKEKQLRN